MDTTTNQGTSGQGSLNDEQTKLNEQAEIDAAQRGDETGREPQASGNNQGAGSSNVNPDGDDELEQTGRYDSQHSGDANSGMPGNDN